VRTRAAANKIRVVARGPLALEAHMNAFVAQLQAHHYSRSLQGHARRILPRLFTHLRAAKIQDVRAVGEEHVVSFARALAGAKTARGTLPALQTQNSYLAIVRRFFQHLEKSGAILRNPAVDLPLRKADVLPGAVLSEAQVERLIGAPDTTKPVGKRDVAVLETLYGTAIRLSECVRLDLQDLDLGEGSLLVRDGKGKRDRVVPVPARAGTALDVYLTEARPHFVHDPKEPALFLERRGGRLSPASIGLLVNVYGRAVGVRVSPHGLRHACATHLLRGGADIRHVQRLLGHRDIQTTARYTRVSLNDLREVLERVHPRERTGKNRRYN
jgi:integrase/recombinase XerD